MLRTILYSLLLTFTALSVAAQEPVAKTPGVVAVIHEVDLTNLLNRLQQQGGVRVGVPGSPPQSVFNVVTGLVVDLEGHVVTRLANLDPDSGEHKITVVTGDGVRVPARLIGVDFASGFSVLKVDSIRLTMATTAPTATLSQGSPVKILSADLARRPITSDAGKLLQLASAPRVIDGNIEGATVYSQVRGALPLRSDALLSRNDSSIVMTADQRVLGLTEYAGFGRAYLFPVDFLRNSVAKRVLEREGNVPTGWLGITGESAPQTVQSQSASGVIVKEVTPDSPASMAGLRENDLIVALNDFPVTSTADLSLLLSSQPVDSEIRMKVVRESGQIQVSTRLGPKPAQGPAWSIRPSRFITPSLAERERLQSRLEELKVTYRAFLKTSESPQRNEALREIIIEIRQLNDALRIVEQQIAELQRSLSEPEIASTPSQQGVSVGVGFTVIGLTPQLAQHFASETGVLIVDVVASSRAAQAGLQAGDVVVKVAGQTLVTVRQLEEHVKSSSGQLELQIIRRKQPVTVTVYPK